MTILTSCEKCKSKLRFANEQAGAVVPCPKCGASLRIEGKTVADHDAFISYAKQDRQIAETIVNVLEARKLRCWIAPRNIEGGATWAASIVQAVDGTRVMVLVYSVHADRSKQVLREVERAISKGLILIPVRIGEFVMSAEMEYYLSATQWLDSTKESINDTIKGLADLIQAVKSSKLESPLPVIPTRRRFFRKVAERLVIAIGAMSSGLAAGIWFATPASNVRIEKIKDMMLQHLEAHVSYIDEPRVATSKDKIVLTARYRCHMVARDFLQRMARSGQTIVSAWTHHNQNALRIFDELEQPSSVDFNDIPLKDGLGYLEAVHGISIVVDNRALSDEGISQDAPVICSVTGEPLRSVLDRILEPLLLAYCVPDNYLSITTQVEADRHPLTAIYDVSSVVI